MRKFLIAALVLLLTGFSCKKEKIDIDGFTLADGVGNPMGAADPTDWTLDANWKSGETALFNNITSANLTGTSTGPITVYPAYPNPCTNSFAVVINSSAKCVIRFALVDSRLNIKFSGSLPLVAGFNNVAISPDLSKLTRPGAYRLYYVFDAEGHPVFAKGHGDVLFNN